MRDFLIPKPVDYTLQELIFHYLSPMCIYDKYPLKEITFKDIPDEQYDLYHFNYMNQCMDESYLDEKIVPFIKNLKPYRFPFNKSDFIIQDLYYLYNMRQFIYTVENSKKEVISICYGTNSFDLKGFIFKALIVRDDYHDKGISLHLIDLILKHHEYSLLIEDLEDSPLPPKNVEDLGFVNIGCNIRRNILFKGCKDYREYEILQNYRKHTPIGVHEKWNFYTLSTQSPLKREGYFFDHY